MVNPVKIDSKKVVLSINNELTYYQVRNFILAIDSEGYIKLRFRIPGLGLLDSIFNYFSLTRRIFRLGVHHLKFFDGKIYLVTKSGIFFRKKK